jgi:two-component system, response regulator PdtaR
MYSSGSSPFSPCEGDASSIVAARRRSELAPTPDHAARNLFGSGDLDLFAGSVRLRILLVEDEPFILMDIELQLQQESHLVVSASDADKAIVVLRRQTVDLVLTDIDMPGSMDGLGLAAAVRDRWPSVRIVVMSGKQRPTVDELPSEARFVSKPFNKSQLLQAVGA